MIRIVIADDHPQVRSSLRHVLELEPDVEVVGEAEDGARALEEVERTHPNLILLDYRMPRVNGIQAAREIGHVAPETAMVMLTSEDDPEVRAQAAAAGVTSYMLKSGRVDELLRTIRAAARESRRTSITVVLGTEQHAEDKLSPPRIA